MSKVYYLAGPMSHVAQFNIPAFDAAAADLRTQGYTIISPAELDDAATRERLLASPDGAPGSPASESWGTYLSRDIKIVVGVCQGIILLPDWHQSRGAKLEAFAGLLCGHEFRLYHGFGPAHEVPASFVRSSLHG